jgi:hypothetical protein
MSSKNLALVGLVVLTLLSPYVSAETNELEIEALRAQLYAISQRLDALEKSNQELSKANILLQESSQQTAASIADVRDKTAAVAEQVTEKAAVSSWTERIRWKGDFRLRYEGIDEENKSSRNRNRIRARAAIIARAADDVEIGFGLASGGDDPVSSNQTLGSGGSTKGMNLDLAYFSWSGLENTRIVGGKFKNILYKPGKNPMLWDGDWNPEGLGLAWADGDYFVNAIGTWLESDSKKETEFSYGVQAGFRKSVGDGMNLTAGIGFYKLGTKGKGSFHGDDDDFYGNSFDPVTNTYLFNYEEIELFADLGFELGGKPASVFFDYVQNQDAGAFDTGYAAGFKYGSARAQGTWELAWIYQDLEADAAFGLVTDSDYAGGGMDGSGHILKGGYAIAKNWNANFTYFITEKDADAGYPHDYDRLQLDLAMKF